MLGASSEGLWELGEGPVEVESTVTSKSSKDTTKKMCPTHVVRELFP